MSAPRCAVGVTLPAVTLPERRHWRYQPGRGCAYGYEVATPELLDARTVAAYREATGHEPRNLPPDHPAFGQWTYRPARTLADRAEDVRELTGLHMEVSR